MSTKPLMNAAAIDQTLAALAEKILTDPALLNPSTPPAPPVLIGIRSRGELIAQRLAAELTRRSPQMHIDIGTLDITFHRDDLASRRAITIPQGTDMNFRIDDRAVVLCDDVLETGRSIRAALDALVDFGRPRLIRLAVLIDRGRREFPIAADYVGLRVDAPRAEQKIIVHLQPTDSENAVFLEE